LCIIPKIEGCDGGLSYMLGCHVFSLIQEVKPPSLNQETEGAVAKLWFVR